MIVKPAYYNEIDEYAAQWLRNLIAAGHIAPGDVDTRSIEDVKPDDLRPYTQCHFFAGIGVWSLALRRAGWADDRHIWTASCPCQPFSAAGQGAGFADERHLWPHLYHLIDQRQPAIVVGEQVASKDADPWLDLVHTDLEAVDYAFGAIAFPSAGIGAPHIRDRTYWAAHANDTRSQGRGGVLERAVECAAGARGVVVELANTQCLAGRCQAESADHRGTQADRSTDRPCGCGCAPCRLADITRSGRREGCADAGGRAVGDRSQGLATGSVHGGSVDRLVYADGGNAGAKRQQRSGQQRQQPQDRGRLRMAPSATFDADTGAGPTNGLWRDADWLFCRDGKWRPVEPGTFPLAHGSPARVGRLRAYGNAVNASAARIWIETVMDCIPA